MSTGTRFGCLFVLLAVGNVALLTMSHGQPVPERQPLASLPMNIGPWAGRGLGSLPGAELRVLRADDYLLREYVRTGVPMAVFIAYYEEQRSGDAMHSPKNCLPGSGWEPMSSRVIEIPDPTASGSAFRANDYIIARNGQQQEVVYWYQAGGKRYASEYLGKIYLVWNAMAHGRTDGALIRLSAPHVGDTAAIHKMMVEFAQELTRRLPQFLPN